MTKKIVSLMPNSYKSRSNISIFIDKLVSSDSKKFKKVLSHFTLFDLKDRGKSGTCEGVCLNAWSCHILVSALSAWVMCLSARICKVWDMCEGNPCLKF